MTQTFRSTSLMQQCCLYVSGLVCTLQGAMYSCQAPDGSLYDADYVLPPGEHISLTWCLNGSLQVTTSAYHSSINVTIPPYTPQRE